MDKKKDTPAEVETVTVTMSRPVAEAVQAACEMYLRLHMGQFNDLAEDLCMAKHYADMDAKRFKNAEDEKEDFYRALENRNMMQDDMDRAYQMFACHPLIEDGMRIPYRAEQVWLGIRHALAWHDKPEGDWTNVSFDKPLNRSDQPQPTVKLTTTADHEPKRDGKKANKDGNVEKLQTMGSPSAAAMHHVIWEQVEPDVQDTLEKKLEASIQKTLARAAAKKGAR